MPKVTLLNSLTCGIYKNGHARYKTAPDTGLRTEEVDNKLLEDVDLYLKGKKPDGSAHVDLSEVFGRSILVPTYFDDRFNRPIRDLLEADGVDGVTIGKLIDDGQVTVRGGHGSPGNDQRHGSIPYIKVSDIRGLRININPTNLVTEAVAMLMWRRGRSQEKVTDSGLLAWDLVTPNRASSNIGEFAILMPGEERVVITKEVFVFRIGRTDLFDHFYLLWAFCLKAVREQWRRIALMQTNREDCGNRYREVIIPKPKSRVWADRASAAFRSHFLTIDAAKREFVRQATASEYEYIASAFSSLPAEPARDDVDDDDAD